MIHTYETIYFSNEHTHTIHTKAYISRIVKDKSQMGKNITEGKEHVSISLFPSLNGVGIHLTQSLRSMILHSTIPSQVDGHIVEDDDDLISQTLLALLSRKQERRPPRHARHRPLAPHHVGRVSIDGVSRGKGWWWWWVAAAVLMMVSSPTTTDPSRQILVHAWTAEWIPVPQSNHIVPPRSGHVAFSLQDNQVYVFGGYAEQQDEEPYDDETRTTTTTAMPIRYPINDLWAFDGDTLGWKCVHPASLWGTIDTAPTATATTAQREGKGIPQQRLAAAAVGLSNKALVLGGWDSQEAGTGGVILNSIDLLALESEGDATRTDPVWKMDPSVNLGEPTSRQVAVALSDTTVLMHNHRCTDHVLLIELPNNDEDDDGNKMTIRRQPTTGAAPSPRGLHTASVCSLGNKVVVFGGAAQTGEMSNELFVLYTITWEWSEIKVYGDVPTPRASPCFCVLEEDCNPPDDTTQHSSHQATFVLFGGADRSLAGEGVPLHGCNDLWLLHLTFHDDEGGPQSQSKTMATWERLLPTTSTTLPPGRNAATLTPLPNQPHTFVLQGGWYPFRKTHRETYLLKLKKD